jgi:hypothetical protein
MIFARWFLNQNILVRGVLGGLFVGVLAVFNLLELFSLFPPVSIVGGIYLAWKILRGAGVNKT